MVEKGEESIKISYLQEVLRLENSVAGDEEKMKLFEILARDFLTKTFHVRRNMEYSEMAQYFTEKQKPQISTFCHNMVIALYSGESISKDKISSLSYELKIIMEQELHKPQEGKGFLKGLFSNSKKEDKTPVVDNYVGLSAAKTIEKGLHEIKVVDPIVQTNEEIQQNTLVQEKQQSRIEEKVSPVINIFQMKDKRDNHPFIESIDDFARIKRKIKDKKREVYSRVAIKY